jgi:hypothetical protein
MSVKAVMLAVLLACVLVVHGEFKMSEYNHNYTNRCIPATDTLQTGRPAVSEFCNSRPQRVDLPILCRRSPPHDTKPDQGSAGRHLLESRSSDDEQSACSGCNRTGGCPANAATCCKTSVPWRQSHNRCVRTAWAGAISPGQQCLASDTAAVLPHEAP